VIRTGEHEHQKALFEWAERKSHYEIPELKLMFAIPNGGARHIAVARKLKAEGVKAGVPDIFLPVARHGYHGLFIELKTPTGTIPPKQRLWVNDLMQAGYFAYFCFGSNQAIELIEYYMGKTKSFMGQEIEKTKA
jgi:VRR-NUC domain